MSEKTPLPSLADFETIEAAVMETARGRWFLAEYARRVRSTEIGLVLSAIARLEAGVADDRLEARDTADLEASLADMAVSFTRMAAELTAVIIDARAEMRASPRVDSAPAPERFAPDAFEPAPREAVETTPTVVAPPVAPDEPPTVVGSGTVLPRRSVTERMSALADLDLLDTREKLRRFT